MVDPYHNLSTSSMLSLKAADAALEILNEKVSQIRKPLVIGTDAKLYSNQFKCLAKLELAELERLACSIAAITSTKTRILEAELICKTSENMMGKAITDAFNALGEVETQINGMHGKLMTRDYEFLDGPSSSKTDLQGSNRISTETIVELPPIANSLNKAYQPASNLNESLAALGITNPANKFDLRPPVYTSIFAKEILERKETDKRLQQPVSARKPMLESRRQVIATNSVMQPTPSSAKPGRMSVIASGGSSLTGSPYFADQVHNNSGTDPFSNMPFRDRLLQQSSIQQPLFDESSIFEGGNLELAFIEESPSESDVVKENDNYFKPATNIPHYFNQAQNKVHVRPSLRTPLSQRPSDFFARSFRPSLASKPGDIRPSLAFELKRPVYTSSIGKQFNIQ